MTNFLAVATVTEALRHFIERNLQPEIGFAVSVRAQKPPTEPFPDATITVFCYQVSPNPAQRSRDAPIRAADGTLLNRARAVLDLHYLISFYGDETLLQPQRMLGTVVRGLYEWPVLSDADIAFAAGQPFLTGTDLPAALDRVRFTATHLDIDDSYKLWTMLSQTPFALSLTYQASVIAIDGRNIPEPGKPVLERTVHALPDPHPVVGNGGQP